LLGIPKIEFKLESKPVKEDDFVVSQFQIGGEHDHMRLSLCVKIGLEQDDHVQGKAKLCGEKCVPW
jgi:hypothetical protein